MPWIRCPDPAVSRWSLISWGAGATQIMPGIRFEPCGVTSFHPDDIRNRYCVFCHRFIDGEAPEEATA